MANGQGGPVTCLPQSRRQERAARRDARSSAATMPPRSTPTTRAALEDALADALEPSVRHRQHRRRLCADEGRDQPAAGDGARRAALTSTVAFPFFVDRDSRMTFRAGAPVDPGPWGILQPAADAAIVSPDLILMPLVAVDGARQSHRHGQGPLRPRPARPARGRRAADRLRLGLPADRRRRSPPDPWDVPLDGFASPDGLEMFR